MSKKPVVTVIGLGGYSIFMDLESFPVESETTRAEDCFTEPGGKGYNQAVGCARLGAQTTFISAFGDDIYGKECIDLLKKEGINTSYIKTVKGKSTAVGVILTDAQGANQISVYPGAIERLEPKDILAAERVISQSDVLLIQLEIPYNTVKCAVDLADRYDVKVILDPAPAMRLDEDLLKQIYIVTPNEFEARVISGSEEIVHASSSALAEKIKGAGAENVIITLGAKGALLSYGGVTADIDPITMPRVVDTTGAGDTFNAALGVCIARGIDILQAAKYATIASALSVRKKGVMGSIPYPSEIEEFEDSDIASLLS